MPITTRPAAMIEAPADEVWARLSEPTAFGAWLDARIERVSPPGPVSEGQVIEGSSPGPAWRWPVRIEVLGVQADRHRLRLRTTLPLGVEATHQIVVLTFGERATRVQFARDINFPGGPWGWMLERLMAKACKREVQAALMRLKDAVEAGD